MEGANWITDIKWAHKNTENTLISQTLPKGDNLSNQKYYNVLKKRNGNSQIHFLEHIHIHSDLDNFDLNLLTIYNSKVIFSFIFILHPIFLFYYISFFLILSR